MSVYIRAENKDLQNPLHFSTCEYQTAIEKIAVEEASTKKTWNKRSWKIL